MLVDAVDVIVVVTAAVIVAAVIVVFVVAADVVSVMSVCLCVSLPLSCCSALWFESCLIKMRRDE